MTFAAVDGSILLVSDRAGYAWRTLVIDDSDEAAIFGLLAQPRSLESLEHYARESLAGRVDLAGLLERWRELGMIFSDGGQLIHVAVEARNQELTRVSAPGIAVRAIAARRLRDESADMPQGADG